MIQTMDRAMARQDKQKISVQDIKRTEELEKASKIMGITLCDHVIIGDGCYTSLKEIGKLS